LDPKKRKKNALKSVQNFFLLQLGHYGKQKTCNFTLISKWANLPLQLASILDSFKDNLPHFEISIKL
jgi:hypothetical protein